MGAFNGLNLYRHKINQTCDVIPKTEPAYIVTFLSVGETYYGLEDSVLFNDETKALSFYNQLKDSYRRAVLTYVDEYRRRTTISGYIADEGYYNGFHLKYVEGVVE